jgi:hypothetical protein
MISSTKVENETIIKLSMQGNYFELKKSDILKQESLLKNMIEEGMLQKCTSDNEVLFFDVDAASFRILWSVLSCRTSLESVLENSTSLDLEMLATTSDFLLLPSYLAEAFRCMLSKRKNDPIKLLEIAKMQLMEANDKLSFFEGRFVVEYCRTSLKYSHTKEILGVIILSDLRNVPDLPKESFPPNCDSICTATPIESVQKFFAAVSSIKRAPTLGK